MSSLTEIWRLEPEEVPELLGTTPEGLTPEEARRRLAAAGPNRLLQPPRRPLARKLLDLLTHPMALLLWLEVLAIWGLTQVAFLQRVFHTTPLVGCPFLMLVVGLIPVIRPRAERR